MGDYIVRRTGSSEYPDELYHWKYISKKMVNGKWRYFYDPSELKKYANGTQTTTKVRGTTANNFYRNSNKLLSTNHTYKGNKGRTVNTYHNKGLIRQTTDRAIAKGEKFIYNTFLKKNSTMNKALRSAGKAIDRGKQFLSNVLKGLNRKIGSAEAAGIRTYDKYFGKKHYDETKSYPTKRASVSKRVEANTTRRKLATGAAHERALDARNTQPTRASVESRLKAKTTANNAKRSKNAAERYATARREDYYKSGDANSYPPAAGTRRVNTQKLRESQAAKTQKELEAKKYRKRLLRSYNIGG